MTDMPEKKEKKKKGGHLSGEATQQKLSLAMHWVFLFLILAMALTGVLL